jgi:hypothetical protein
MSQESEDDHMSSSSSHNSFNEAEKITLPRTEAFFKKVELKK